MLSLRSRHQLKNTNMASKSFDRHHMRLQSALQNIIPPSTHPLHNIAKHHFTDTGKMLRGLTALVFCETLKVSEKAALHWALAIELLHNASLVHDDLCDGDETRRQHMTVWKLFGLQQAICFGDWLVGQSFEQASMAARAEGNTAELTGLLARHMSVLSSGQASEFTLSEYPNWARYVDIVHGKTTPLIMAPVEGAILLSQKQVTSKHVYKVLQSLGLAYQISDDIRNILGTDGAQHAYGDLKRRAPNAVVILFKQNLMNGRLSDFEKWLSAGHIHDLDDWRQEIINSLALDLAVSEIEHRLNEVDEAMRAMPEDFSSVLKPLTHFLTQSCLQAAEQVSANNKKSVIL